MTAGSFVSISLLCELFFFDGTDADRLATSFADRLTIRFRSRFVSHISDPVPRLALD